MSHGSFTIKGTNEFTAKGHWPRTQIVRRLISLSYHPPTHTPTTPPLLPPTLFFFPNLSLPCFTPPPITPSTVAYHAADLSAPAPAPASTRTGPGPGLDTGTRIGAASGGV
jgi:hypothetical protein